jgi:hypothetical protein
MAYTNYIHRTPSGTGDRRTFTISTWVKRPNPVGQGWIMTVDSYSSGNMFQCQFDTGSNVGVQQYHGSSIQTSVNTNNLLRDPSAWFHLVLRVDTTQSTAADRVRIYINGTEASYTGATSYPSQNFQYEVNDAKKHSIGSREDTSSGASLYYSHYHFCDGYSYAPTEFGETDSTTGEWKIKTSPSVSYGTNGFFIFKDGMNLSGSTVQDQSGQGNNLTLVGSSVETQDTPSNNFCTLNFLDRSRKASNNLGDALENGNTTFNTSNAVKAQARGTIGVMSGKYYWEGKYNSGTAWAMGFCLEEFFADTTADFWDSTSILAVAANGGSGTLYISGRASDSFNTGVSISGGDILGFALDIDNKGFYVHKNGTYITANSAVGDPTSGSSRTGSVLGELTTGGYQNYIPDNEFIYPVTSDSSTGASASMDMNFGNGYFGTTAISSEGTNASGIGKFEYDVPTGYTALSTKGLNL